MRNISLKLTATLAALACAGSVFASDAASGPVQAKPYHPGVTMTQAVQAGITPERAVEILKAGNQRFVQGKPTAVSLKKKVSQTALGQFPFASVVACIDSRSAPELVFDQSIGDLFVARVAGNVVNEDILGSLEYAAKVAGSRAIVVLGHTNCGAVKGACDGVKMGNLTGLLDKIQPAVSKVSTAGERNSKNHSFVRDVTEMNIDLTMQAIRDKSPILKEMEAKGEIRIVGALLDTASGKVSWH